MDLKAWIKNHEGFRSHPYFDTCGKLTIGWGRNIESNGITPEEADFLLKNDIARCKQELSLFSWYKDQPRHVQCALINMCFNLGIHRLLGFSKMISALQAYDYTKAAQEALDSRWAQQVGQRAKDIALTIREGNDPATGTDITD